MYEEFAISDFTPLMQQYITIKSQYKDAILLFRLGDFYETFFEDAKILSQELNIVLTSRYSSKKHPKIPLAGIPYHAIENYLTQLVSKGYKIAICEQIEDPKFAKGIVKREVVRVITPGTLTEQSMLKSKNNNFLGAVTKYNTSYGCAFLDVSTGEFFATEFTETGKQKTINELIKFSPVEYIVDSTIYKDKEFHLKNAVVRESETLDLDSAQQYLLNHFNIPSLQAFGCENMPSVIISSATALKYASEQLHKPLYNVAKLTIYQSNEFMYLDGISLRNLEIIKNIRDGTQKNTLHELLDKTQTSMGGRYLRKCILQPLCNINDILERINKVEFFVNDTKLRYELIEKFKKIQDIERLITRVTAHYATPRDLIALKNSLSVINDLPKEILEIKIPDFRDVIGLIDRAIVPEPPPNIKSGYVINDGFDKELDAIKNIVKDAKQWIAELEVREIQVTGIKSLKVGYNQVFGYYIEVTKPNLPYICKNYIRKQTLANAERFITPELKEKEALILNSEEKIIELEQTIYLRLLDDIAKYAKEIQHVSECIAKLDLYINFAQIAIENSYIKPEFNNDGKLIIRAGRHPIVEKTTKVQFVVNDANLDTTNTFMVITGPNMSGKSTYMRQIALICLMAQIGSYVPAKYANLPIIDKIFTRVGAFDDIVLGQSTFMVEMLELANILNNASKNSLIVLDEIGRGTSTFDGLAIAWAVAEYIANKIKCKTMFATHYHQITELSEIYKNIMNYQVAVKEENGKLVFLYKVLPGGTNKSYGIEVAKLAGVPKEIINRAHEILKHLETEEISLSTKRTTKPTLPRYTQMLFVDTEDVNSEIIKEIKNIDIEKTTPIDALLTLQKLKKLLKK